MRQNSSSATESQWEAAVGTLAVFLIVAVAYFAIIYVASREPVGLRASTVALPAGVRVVSVAPGTPGYSVVLVTVRHLSDPSRVDVLRVNVSETPSENIGYRVTLRERY